MLYSTYTMGRVKMDMSNSVGFYRISLTLVWASVRL